MIERNELRARILKALHRSPVVALLGPRQCGKTTMSHAIAAEIPSHSFDLEDPDDDRVLKEPRLNLASLDGLIILDEIQRRPDLFPVIRVLADRAARSGRFMLLGSASPDLMRESSESLAGRIEFIDMTGFTLDEVGFDRMDLLWHRGGFPRSFLAESDDDSQAWRRQFIRTFLERDVARLGFDLSPDMMLRFWTMIAHFHGQVWNASAIGRSLGRSHTAVSGYLDILEGAYMVRRLRPWLPNIGKRLVKAPKVYIRDAGLLHTLLRLHDRAAILSHPSLGASWEGFALEHVLQLAGEEDTGFYRTHGGTELDLVVAFPGRRIGFEFKYAGAPSLTKSMHVAMDDLGLDALCVVHPGPRRYTLKEKVDAVPLAYVREWIEQHRT